MKSLLDRRLASAAALCSFGVATWAVAQMHRVEKPEAVVRAVGVYEWTGELAKPAASRLIPVTVFINGELEDGGIYQPRPIPFALTPGNAYELQQAGVSKGLLELHSAGKQPNADVGNIDGWWGYGSLLRESHSASRTAHPAPSPVAVSADADARPANPDADRPTLRRRSTTAASKTSASPGTATDPASTPADDPDRPTLKRHAPETASTRQDGGDATPEHEIQTDALNNDPNRPLLHRGRPAGGTGGDSGGPADSNAPTSLAGLPEDLHQMVAVSDAANRPEHDFARPWSDDAEHRSVQASMEAIARAKLAAYDGAPSPGSPRSGALVGAKDAEGNPVSPTGGPAFSPSGGAAAGASATKTASAKAAVPARPTTPAARRRAAAAAAAAKKKASASPATPLLGEDLRGFLLSYGGAPTYVLTAHTAGAGGLLHYVTVVAQQDAFGTLQTAFSSVTDSSHLDRTPWMRLVGVVDAEASNRASLLFELREGGARQFALYRVLSGRSEPLFTTGLTQ